jgi:hypothetical protein
LASTLRKDLFFPLPFIILIKCILIVQGGFTLVLQVCIYCALLLVLVEHLDHLGIFLSLLVWDIFFKLWIDAGFVSNTLCLLR